MVRLNTETIMPRKKKTTEETQTATTTTETPSEPPADAPIEPSAEPVATEPPPQKKDKKKAKVIAVATLADLAAAASQRGIDVRVRAARRGTAQGRARLVTTGISL